MASASLELEDEREGRLVFRVEADPFDAPPFEGPAGRSWDAFKVESPACATYQWRTGADLIREQAQRLVREGLSGDAVEAAFAGSDYLCELFESTRESLEDEAECRRKVLRDLASGVIDPAASDAGAQSYYHFEDDVHLGHAAEALPLPPGAEVDEADDGGPGSGFSARVIVLPEAMTLSDFAAWLEAQPIR